MPGGMAGLIGAPVVRKEDPRLLTGRGRYVADLTLPGMAHVAFLRSVHAHARIRGIEVAAARRVPGVVAVFTAEDMGPLARPIPCTNPWTGVDPRLPTPLAVGKVRYVGEPVALVVAESRYAAEDALEEIDVDYEPLPAVVEVDAALAHGGTRVHDDLPGNLAARLVQRVGDPDGAFRTAPVVVRGTFRIDRGAGLPIETRGVVAHWDAAAGVLTEWTSTQSPHVVRKGLAPALGLAESRVRVIAPDVGGGFGPKCAVYAEEIAVAWAAMRVGRPLKWVEDRREHMLATYQERRQTCELELAAKADGTLLGLRARYWVDQGAYMPWGVVIAYNIYTHINGCYRIPNLSTEGMVVYTNKVPLAAVRGAGRNQANFFIERMIDKLARTVGLSPVEIRRRNLIQPEAFPYNTGLTNRFGHPVTYDSGNFQAALEQAVAALGYDQDFRAEQARARAEGRLLGVGVVTYVEETGMGPYEGATVRVDTSGVVTVYTGTGAQGQGHETTFAQIAGASLGVDYRDVRVVHGDTDAFPTGFGTIASRVGTVAGNAVRIAAQGVARKVKLIAARLLEAAEQDVELANGRAHVRGVPGRSVTLADVARAAAGPLALSLLQAGTTPVLEDTRYFSPTGTSWASGAHAAVVEVFPATGAIKVHRYVVVHDSGRVINPLIVDGQVVGGVAHGIGNALLEEIHYDDNGQAVSGSLMDYLIPTAVEIPEVEVIHQETPAPTNPLGLKGAGEGGCIPVPAAIAQAVDDATGLFVTEMPLTHRRVWELLHPSEEVAR